MASIRAMVGRPIKSIDPARLNATQRRIWDFFKSRGVDMKRASTLAGRAATYMRDYFADGIPAELPEAVRENLARELQVPPEFFRKSWKGEASQRLLSTTVNEDHKAVDVALQPEISRSGDATRLATEQENLPVFGYVAGRGEDDVFFIDQGHLMTRTVRPAPLRNVTDAYAVDVYGESMSPVYEPGDRLWVHPRRPYKAGNDVVVQLDGERAILKRVARRTEKHLILKQFNPAKEIKLEWKDVKQVDLVVGCWNGT